MVKKKTNLANQNGPESALFYIFTKLVFLVCLFFYSFVVAKNCFPSWFLSSFTKIRKILGSYTAFCLPESIIKFLTH